MISYAIATFLNKYERFRVFVLLGSLGLMAIAIVTYILSIKNNPNKIKLFRTKKMMLIFLLSFCATIILLMILMYEHK